MNLFSNQGKFIPFRSTIINREINEKLTNCIALVFSNVRNRSFLYFYISSFKNHFLSFINFLVKNDMTSVSKRKKLKL